MDDIQGLTQTMNDLKSATDGLSVPEGVSEKETSLNESFESLSGEMKNLAAAVIALNTSTVSLDESTKESSDDKEDNWFGSFLDELKKDFSSVFGDLFGSLGFGKKQKEDLGVKKATKAKPKAEDLLKLSDRDALGFLLIANKLDEIKAGNEKNKKSNGFADIFKGLLKGVAGIALLAVALIVFAGAAIMFSMINWGAAIVGLVMFSAFVVGAIVLSKLMGKNLKAFVDLAVGSALLCAGLLVFSLALVVTAWSAQMILSMGVGGILGLVGILAVYGLFVFGAAKVGQQLGENTKYLKDLAIGSVLLAAGLAIFSLALVVTAWSAQKIISMGSDGIVGLVGILVLYAAFVTGAALLGKLLGKESKSVQDLAIGSIILAVGLVVFSLALYIVQEIAKNVDIVNGVLPTLGLFTGFVILMTILGKIIEKNISSVIAVGVGALLMTVSLFLFAATLKYINETIDASTVLTGIGTLILMAGFLAAYIAMGMVIISSGGLFLAAVALTAVAFIGIAISLMAFGKALDVIKENIIKPSDYLNALAILGLGAVLIVGMIPLGAMSLLAIPATLLFSVWSTAAAQAFVNLGTVVGILSDDAFKQRLAKADEALVGKDKISISKFIDDVNSALPNAIAIAAFGIKMALFEALTINMAASFLSLQKVINSIEYIRNKMPSDKDMEPVLTLMERVVNITSKAIESVKGTSAKALASIGQTVKDICSGIDTMSEVVIKLKSITPADVNAGTENIRLMTQKLFGSEEDTTGMSITTLFGVLKKVGKGAGPAAEALIPITTSLSSLSDTVKSLVGIQGLDEGISNSMKIGELMAKLAIVFGTSAGDTGGWFKSSSSEKLAEAKKSFDEIANIITGPVKTIASGITSLDNISNLGKKVENLLPSDIENFPNKMKKFEDGTKEFKKGVESLSAINNIKLEKLDIIKSALTDISKITMVDTLRPLTELLNRSNDLDKIKDTLKEINKLSKKNDSLGIATVQAAPKLSGSESTKDILSMIYTQLFEGSGVKISNWPTFQETKGFGKDPTITPVANFL